MNYSFYDEMDELDDIINESTDEEIFIESMEELFEEKSLVIAMKKCIIIEFCHCGILILQN